MNTALHVQELEKKKKKALMQKEFWNNGNIPLSDLSKGKVIENICLACPLSFKNFTATINVVGKMYMLNLLTSTH